MYMCTLVCVCVGGEAVVWVHLRLSLENKSVYVAQDWP